jgi:hypothetical protein
MADETCVQVNCCPLGYSVPGLGGTLALSGDDSTATDPNIADGELVLAEEAEWVNCIITTAGSSTLFGLTTPPVMPLTVTDFQNVQVGFFAYAVAVGKVFTCTVGSPTITCSSTVGISVGDIIELVTTYFPYGTTVLSISAPDVTLSNNALVSTPVGVTDTLISFRPTTGSVKIGGSPLIPVGTVVSSLALSSVVLSNATLAPSAMSRVVVAFYPAELDPNVFDEAQLFT